MLAFSVVLTNETLTGNHREIEGSHQASVGSHDCGHGIDETHRRCLEARGVVVPVGAKQLQVNGVNGLTGYLYAVAAMSCWLWPLRSEGIIKPSDMLEHNGNLSTLDVGTEFKVQASRSYHSSM